MDKLDVVSAADIDKHLSYNDVTMTTPGSTTTVRLSAVKTPASHLRHDRGGCQASAADVHSRRGR